MAKLENLMPAELRERLAITPRQRVHVWRSEHLHGAAAARHNALEQAEQRERSAAERAVTDWLRTALESGELAASGYPSGAALDAAPTPIPPARWRALRYDWNRNAAIDCASGAVALTGLDFERRQAEPPASAHAASDAPDQDAVADEFVRRGERPTRAIFRAACAGAKFAVTDTCYKRRFGSLKPHERRKVRGDR